LRDSARELARKLGDRGLKLADLYLQTAPDFVSLAPNHPEPARRAQARDLYSRALEFAAVCGCRHLTALPGVYFDNETADKSLGRCRDELAWRCAEAEKQSVTFSVEAHVGSIVPSPGQAAQLVRDTPGLTLTLDYTHFTREGVADVDIEPLVAHASHFHARCARPGRLQSSFKENVIDYGRVLEVMESTGYAGFVGIEYVWIDWEHCNEVDNLSETILLRDFFQRREVAS
jgi:sugar phosphate isomerase/epimerase